MGWATRKWQLRRVHLIDGVPAMPQPNDPGVGVLSREFGEKLGGRLVVKTSQAGAIVVGDEGVEIGIAFGMVEKAAVEGGTVLRHAAEMLAEAAVEAFAHAIGLRPEGLGEAVG